MGKNPSCCSQLTLILSGGLDVVRPTVSRWSGGRLSGSEALFHFAVFNFADCCVVIGVVLFAIYFLFVEPKLNSKAKATAEGEQKNA